MSDVARNEVSPCCPLYDSFQLLSTQAPDLVTRDDDTTPRCPVRVLPLLKGQFRSVSQIHRSEIERDTRMKQKGEFPRLSSLSCARIRQTRRPSSRVKLGNFLEPNIQLCVASHLGCLEQPSEVFRLFVFFTSF